MANLYFYHGVMGSSKSTELLTKVHKYEEQGKKVLLLKPSIDTRSEKGFIESRTGLKHSCIDVIKECNLFNLINYKGTYNAYDCIFVDEANFLTKEQVKQLRKIVDRFLGIDIKCYGLKNTYIDGELFEGSQALLYYADVIEEIDCTCQFCKKDAKMNLRVVNGSPIYNGDTIQIGDTEQSIEYYVPTCYYHYYKPQLDH
ncbi:thymidine kinase (plasmid) [Clostridium tetani]|uniref:thymidine kinase n=1 Tax=Clostridium tetani TaxID=1513 RepID=UPI0029555123|nr:thymidine kinase [Clostridium tetani]BDR74241.1 thymidine kinase [Clostridium tetani]